MSSSPSTSNSDKTFTIDPSGNLTHTTTYKIRVTTGVKDAASNTLSSQYETSSGFTTSGLFVAVGNSGKILTSDNGTSWDERSSGTTSTLIGITYGNNKFMTMSGDKTGTMLTSSNGTSWTSTSWTCSDCTPDPDNNSIQPYNFTLEDVTYGNSTFVAVGTSGTILTSSDGTSWDNRSSGTSLSLSGVTYGNNKFMTMGSSGTTHTILTSSNGTSWTSNSWTCSACDA